MTDADEIREGQRALAEWSRDAGQHDAAARWQALADGLLVLPPRNEPDLDAGVSAFERTLIDRREVA